SVPPVNGARLPTLKVLLPPWALMVVAPVVDLMLKTFVFGASLTVIWPGSGIAAGKAVPAGEPAIEIGSTRRRSTVTVVDPVPVFTIMASRASGLATYTL